MRNWRTIVVWLGLIGLVIGLFSLRDGDRVARGSSGQLAADVEAGKVLRIEARGEWYRVYADRTYEVSAYEISRDTMGEIAARNIPVAAVAGDASFVDWLPVLVLVGLGVAAVWWFARAQQRGTGLLTDISKSRARLVDAPPATRFSDIGGNEEAKERLADLVDFLRNPKLWNQSGARIPRGVLLEGPPGSGKTLLARAVAGEASVRFFECAGSEFVELMVGVGAARVRDLFENAAKSAPAVIFIDEIDAIGKRRGSGALWVNEEREQTLNQILVAMDGFRPIDRLVVIAATNRADVLDPALVRPGRFDTRLVLPPLSAVERERVMRIHARNKVLASGLDLRAWAERLVGANGARIEQVMNEAALRAVRARKDRGNTVEIRDADLEGAWRAASVGTGNLGPLEQALVTSSWQLVRPDAEVRAKVVLTDGRAIEGHLAWADGSHIELRRATGGSVVVAKAQIVTLET